MIILKVIETSLDFTDPNEIYHNDIESLIIQKLNKRYKNKCYQSFYIEDIKKVIRRSDIKMVDNRQDGGASVDVQFEAEGIVLSQGEIIHGCKISEIRDNIITAENRYACIKLQKSALTQHIVDILKIGNVIPIIVQKVKYTPNQNSISVLGNAFSPVVYSNIYYIINEPLSNNEIEKVNILFEKISSEEEKHKLINKEERYKFFRDLMYAYKSDRKFGISKIATSLELKDVPLDNKLLNIKGGIITYPNEDPKFLKRLFWTKNTDIEENLEKSIQIIDSSLYSVLSEVLTKYLLYLEGLRGFIETYKTFESVKELFTYWQLCQKLQQ